MMDSINIVGNDDNQLVIINLGLFSLEFFTNHTALI